MPGTIGRCRVWRPLNLLEEVRRLATDFQDILYTVDGPLGVITLNRPGYRNAQSYRMLDEIDQAFALANAEVRAGFVEYMSVPWDIGIRRAKELCFESRFISAAEAREYGLVNRVTSPESLEGETYAWARRVAENSPDALRFAKIQMNKA